MPPAHSNRSEQSDLSAYLTAGLTDFKSADTISDFLSRLLHLQSEDRISPRRAAVIVTISLGDLPRPPGSPRYREHAPPSHKDMSWLAPVSGTPGSKESS